jgi:hypothetical protein
VTLVTMTPAPRALLAALDVQARTGQRIGRGQLSLGTPCPLWPVREVINHSIGVTLKFASFAAGHTDHPRAPAGDLVGDDHARQRFLAFLGRSEPWPAT